MSRTHERHSDRGRGFTLVELMIVVAIIGLLASIAVPNFLRYQLRARSTEALTHLTGMARSQEAYYAEFGTYVSVSTPVPATLPVRQRRAWPSGTNFDRIGWSPDGPVIFHYRIGADATGTAGSLNRFTAEAAGDLDANGIASYFGYYKPVNGVALAGGLTDTTCDGSGVFGPGSAAGSAMQQPGGCDPESGRSRF